MTTLALTQPMAKRGAQSRLPLGGRCSRQRAVALVAGCVALAAPIAGFADQERHAPREVIVTTRIVMASNKGVAGLRGAGSKALEKSFLMFPYTSYRLLQEARRPVRMKKMAEFPVPGGRRLLIQPTGFENGRVSLYVMLMHDQKALVNTVLRLRSPGEFVVAGPQYGEGVLFLSIGAVMADPRGLRRAKEAR